MRDIPDYFWKWTEIDFEHNTGERLVKSDVPPDILNKLIDDEISEYELTARRTIINIDLNKRQIIPVAEAVKRYFESEGGYKHE